MRTFAVGVALLVAACGARSELHVDHDASGSDAGARRDEDAGRRRDGGRDRGDAGEGSTCSDDPGPRPLGGAGEGGSYHLATDATHVYWANGDERRVMRVPLCGGETEILAEDQSRAFFVASDGEFVYWTNGNGAGEVSRAPVTGGSVEILWDLERGQPEGLALDDGRLYVTVVSGTDVGLWSLETSGADRRQLLAARVVRAIAVDDESAYTFSEAGLMQVPKTGGGATTLLPGAAFGGALAVDDTHVYWTSWAGLGADVPNVSRVPKTGGEVEVLASGESGVVVGLGVDDTHVYWTSQNDGAVRGRPLAGGPTTTIATGQEVVESLTLFAGGLAWVNFRDGSVWRGPKL